MNRQVTQGNFIFSCINDIAANALPADVTTPSQQVQQIETGQRRRASLRRSCRRRFIRRFWYRSDGLRLRRRGKKVGKERGWRPPEGGFSGGRQRRPGDQLS